MHHLTSGDQGIVFELDRRIADSSDTYSRQIDIWLPNTGEIVECKHHARPVTVGAVDALLGAMLDVDAKGCRVFSHSGFTRTALLRANKAGIQCTTLPFEERWEQFPEPSGNGYYAGDYADLCFARTRGCNSFGRINYGSGEGDESPICVGHSVDWGDTQMHTFISYILLSHHLGRPPAEWAVAGFVEAHGEIFDSGYEWRIEEFEVSRFGVAA
ncbi:hypothetical protein GCM10027074_59610 [Streptomyces deserti]